MHSHAAVYTVSVQDCVPAAAQTQLEHKKNHSQCLHLKPLTWVYSFIFTLNCNVAETEKVHCLQKSLHENPMCEWSGALKMKLYYTRTTLKTKQGNGNVIFRKQNYFWELRKIVKYFSYSSAQSRIIKPRNETAPHQTSACSPAVWHFEMQKQDICDCSVINDQDKTLQVKPPADLRPVGFYSPLSPPTASLWYYLSHYVAQTLRIWVIKIYDCLKIVLKISSPNKTTSVPWIQSK